MPSVFTLISTAWDFYRKQPALNPVLLHFFILPATVLNLLQRLMEEDGPEPWSGLLPKTVPMYILVGLTALVLILVMTWGIACALVVGKRMTQSKAGRARTSFATVRKQAVGFVAPLFFTGILRACLIVYRLILLIIPGVLYSIRTSFYEYVIVFEGKRDREALNRSHAIITGSTWQVLLTWIGLSIVLFAPAYAASIIIENVIGVLDPRLLPAADLVWACFTSMSALLLLLSMIPVYEELNGNVR